jgi:hypothetical protein
MQNKLVQKNANCQPNLAQLYINMISAENADYQATNPITN